MGKCFNLVRLKISTVCLFKWGLGGECKKVGMVVPGARLLDGRWVLIFLQPNGRLPQPGMARCIGSPSQVGLFGCVIVVVVVVVIVSSEWISLHFQSTLATLINQYFFWPHF